MNTRLIADIARSLSLARWKQTLVAAIGVTFSITMFIALLGFMAGLNDLLDGLVLNRTPHIRLYNEIKPNEDQPINRSNHFLNSYNFIRSVKAKAGRQQLYNSKAIMQALDGDKRVFGYSPKITTQIFFNTGTTDIAGFLNGIDVSKEMRLFHFNDYVTTGSAADIALVPNSIVLGKGLADQLLANIGDVVQVTTAGGENFPVKVVGFYQSGLADYDKVQSFASLKTVQKIMGKPVDYVTDIQVKLFDMQDAPTLTREFGSQFQTDAVDIQSANAQYETGSFVRTLISYAVGITLLIVAGFGIFNILNMMIFEKMDAIAILKATGFSGNDVKWVFLLIALGIGLVGGLLGLAGGFLLSAVIDQIPFTTEALPTVKTYPVDYSPVFYFIGLSFSLITTYLAGWFPARKASKIDPVGIIRGK
ncbi:MAG TPA: FtsX-like permease family protein [Hanamia sp.]|nr:FtsX-like permease family protein [Hanamia sp.]